MKRPTILIILWFACSVVSYSQNATQKLVVWLNNETKDYYELAEQPKTSFNGNILNISTNSVSTSYQLENVLRYTYEGAVTKISPLKDKSKGFRQKDDGIVLENMPSGIKIQVYNTEGVLLKSLTTDGSPDTEISLTGYPKGIYIINIDGHSIKIKKK